MALKIDERLLVAAADGTPKNDDRETAPGRLLDLMVLVLAIDAYTIGGDDQQFLDKGLALYRMHRSSIEEAAKKHLDSLMERPDAGTVSAKYRLMEQVDPSKKARFIEEFMVWIKRRTTLMRDVFPGRTYANAAKVAAACEEPDLETRMQKLAVVPTSSGLSSMFKWVRKGAELLGAPAPTVEAISAQVEGAQAIAEEMKEADRKINVEPVGSPTRAALEDRKLDLAADLNEAVEESDDPQIVGSAAASKFAAPSRTAQKFGLTPEQEDVMRSMGKVVIAAGAGSGKTQTLVATIAHLVEEKGYMPSQIMACSFTVAASTELEARVTERAGIHGARIGTTHSMAREIITKNRPGLAQAVKNTKAADKLFKIAMKQVPLDPKAHEKALEQNKDTMARIEAIPGWRSIEILRSFHDQLARGRTLSEKQMAVIPKFEGRGGGGYGGGGYRRRYAEEEVPAVNAVRAAMSQAQLPLPGVPVVAADSDAPSDDRISPYWTTPCGQWFNIGKPIVGDDQKPMGEKRAKLAVENFKNAGQTVEQVRAEMGDDHPLAALYGAYEWLKQNDPVMAPAMDFTDQLVVALDILKNDPAARAAEQRRFKAVLVDEAQDLNQIQFEMFQILGEKADLLGFIGDDKQSIYAFRGAKPKNYVDLSKQEGFQTKLMTMNFRSGKAIVDAANKLIAHNADRQIPMTCDADVERKGMGAIRTRDAADHEDAADQVAQEIKDSCDAGDSPKDFGILVRNNAEHDAYTLALLVRGIPYRLLKRGDGGYFGKPLVRALTAWMRLVVGGSNEAVNEAVLDAHMTPGFGLDKQFGAGLSRSARGQSYLDYILGGNPVYFGKADWMNKRVAEYANAIRTVSAVGGMDSPSLIRAILNIKGQKGTFEDALMKLVDEDDVIEEDGAEAGEEAIRNAAMAPLRPLMIMAENFKDPENLLGFIAKMKAANEKAQKKNPEDKEDWKEPAVLVGTVHGWKGLQAKHCYVCMAGGVFPNFRSDEKEAAGDETAFDEERRLAYVAITRGEQSVTVMAPQKNYLGKPAPMSRFIAEACIPVVGEKAQAEAERGDAPNDEQLVFADPSQDQAGPNDRTASTIRSGLFQRAFLAFSHGMEPSAFDDLVESDLLTDPTIGTSGPCGGDCEGGCKDGGECEGGCKGGCGDKASEDGVTCPCEYDYAR